MNNAYIIIIGSILCGWMYHLGGMGEDGAKQYPKLPKWMFNTKVRDWGCSLVTLLVFYFIGAL